MIGHVENPQKLNINDILNADAKRSAQVEKLPSWMQRENTHVRYGGHEIDLDEGTLPRLDGIMGTVHLFRKGEARMPVTGRLDTPQTPDANPVAQLLGWGFVGVNAVGLLGGAALRKIGSASGVQGLESAGAWMQRGAAVVDTAAILAACGPQSAPTAIATEISSTAIPATEMPVQVTVTPLSNEVVVGTPSSAPETPAPEIGVSYPTEVISLDSPLVYSYGGEAGRQNMNEYTRQMFDRYVAEMSRGGFLAGTSVEELYRAFDQGYDFKLYTTESGLTWLIQSKSDGSFLVPKDENGQIFRDLQLPYDYLFQSGTAVGVGTDNFDFQRFQANKVGFVGAWPVLVNVDSEDIPVSWTNMEQSGSVSPISVASTAEVPTVVPTESGPKNGDTKTITENKHDYLYVYDAEVGQYVRTIAEFPLWDGVKFGYVIVKIQSYESASGERSFYAIKHQDVVSDQDQSPLHSTFKPELEQRYFGLDDLSYPTDEQSATLQKEMMKGLASTATIPIIVDNGTPEGQTLNVKLSTETGINVTIMDVTTIKALGGENIATLTDGEYTFYVHAYGVDEKGNALYRLAFEGSIADVPDGVLRDAIFTIAGNLVDHADQRTQPGVLATLPQGFSDYSERSRDNGEPDYSFVRVPQSQP